MVFLIHCIYDNMCNLERLLVVKKPLPLPAPFCNIWGSVQKIIVTFHLPNHETYNPDKMKAFAPHYNTQSCEQTFAWLGRFKRIVTSISKRHNHFFLHRLVKRRSAYTNACYRKGKKPSYQTPKIHHNEKSPCTLVYHLIVIVKVLFFTAPRSSIQYCNFVTTI